MYRSLREMMYCCNEASGRSHPGVTNTPIHPRAKKQWPPSSRASTSLAPAAPSFPSVPEPSESAPSSGPPEPSAPTSSPNPLSLGLCARVTLPPQPHHLHYFADWGQGGVAPRQQFTQRDTTLQVSRPIIDAQQLSSGSMTGIILGYLTAKIGRLLFFTFSGVFLLAAVQSLFGLG